MSLEVGHLIAEVRLSKAKVLRAMLLIGVPINIPYMLLAEHWAGSDWIDVPAAIELYRAGKLVSVVGLGGIKLVAGLVVLGVIHELCHAIPLMVWGGISWSAIQFGMEWKYGAAFCRCSEPMRMSVFRIVCLFPLIVTGPVAAALLYLNPSFTVVLLASATFGCAIGDVWMCAASRGLPPNAIVKTSDPSDESAQDDSDSLGYDVHEAATA